MALGIDLRVSGFKEAGTAVRGLAEGNRRLADSISEVAARTRDAARVSGEVSQRVGRGPYVSGGRTRTGSAPFRERVERNRAAAREQREAERQEERERKEMLARLRGPRPARDPVQDLVGTTRIGGSIGGIGAFPLINRLVAAAGGSMSTVAGLALAGAAARELASQLRETANRTGEFRGAMLTSGGSPRDVAAASAYGIAPGDFAARANALRERISVTGGNPFALQAAGRLGISPQLPAQFGGGQNNARLYIQALEGLRRLRGSEEQLLQARRLGMEGDLQYVNVSDRVWAAERRLLDERAKFLDPGTTQAMADFSAEVRLLGERLTLAKDRGLSPIVKDWNNALSGLDEISRRLPGNPGGLLKGSHPGTGILPLLLGRFAPKGERGKTPEAAAAEKSRDYLAEIAATLKNGLARPNARGAGLVPSQLQAGYGLQRAIEHRALGRGRIVF